MCIRDRAFGVVRARNDHGTRRYREQEGERGNAHDVKQRRHERAHDGARIMESQGQAERLPEPAFRAGAVQNAGDPNEYDGDGHARERDGIGHIQQLFGKIRGKEQAQAQNRGDDAGHGAECCVVRKPHERCREHDGCQGRKDQRK